MLDKPQIDDDKIIEALRVNYEIHVSQIEFLPIGYDARAAVYRAISRAGQTYFVKLKRDAVDPLSVFLPRYLVAQGIPQVVAPLPTITNALWGAVEDYSLLVYPFIEGQTGMKVGLNDAQWIEFGRILQRIHSVRVPEALSARLTHETFRPFERYIKIIRRTQISIETHTFDDPLRQDVAAFWKAHQGIIDAVVEHMYEMGRVLQNNPHTLVLCHSDIHTNNVMVDTDGALHIVDWDQPMLALKERDLRYIIDRSPDGIAMDHHELLFLRGYGISAIDRTALAFYRYEWALQDIAEFGDQVLFMEGVSDSSKADAMRWFKSMFARGGPVESAQYLYKTL